MAEVEATVAEGAEGKSGLAGGEVQIRTSGGKNSVTMTPGMTVDNALRVAGVKPRWGARLFVDGANAVASTLVKAGSTITVAPRIRNGLA